MIENGKNEQLVRVQKEMLSNYYLQKYKSLMNNISSQSPNSHNHDSQYYQTAQHNQMSNNQINTQSQFSLNNTHLNNRQNFKAMLLNKKNLGRLQSNKKVKLVDEKLHNNDLKKGKSRKEEQQLRTYQILERSLIKQMTGGSPSKLETSNVERILIKKTKSIQKPVDNMLNNPVKQSEQAKVLDDIPSHNSQSSQKLHNLNRFNSRDSYQRQEQKQESRQNSINKIKQAIKNEFQRRKSSSRSKRIIAKYSPQKSNNSLHSHKVQNEINIQNQDSEVGSAGLEQVQSDHNNIRNIKGDVQQHDESQRGYKSDDILLDQQQMNDQVIHNNIQFLPPSSNYYQQQNHNKHSQSFNYQHSINQPSQVQESVRSFSPHQSHHHSLHINTNPALETSKLQISFVSKMSKFSSQSGEKLRQSIENQLYSNEFGPYQSALYNILELIEQYPKVNSILAVGKKTLQDRKAFEQKRIKQQVQKIQYKKKIQKIKKKKASIQNLQYQERQITQLKRLVMLQMRKLIEKQKKKKNIINNQK